MDDKDRDRLIRVDERTKYLVDKWDNDFVPLRKLVEKHEIKITLITAIAVIIWGATVAFFDGAWEHFIK